MTCIMTDIEHRAEVERRWRAWAERVADCEPGLSPAERERYIGQLSATISGQVIRVELSVRLLRERLCAGIRSTFPIRD